MKKNVYSYIIASILFASLFSCEDKDSGINEEKFISVHGLKMELDKAVMWQSDNSTAVNLKDEVFLDTYVNYEGNTVTDSIVGYSVEGTPLKTGTFTVSLYDKDIYHDGDIGITYGKGSVITIHFSSKDIDKLADGEYKYSLTNGENTFVAYSAYDYDFGAESEANTITEGTINVKSISDGYKFDFNCKTYYGSIVKGSYQGKVDSYDARNNVTFVYDTLTNMDAAFDTLYYTLLQYGTLSHNFKPDIESRCLFNTTKLRTVTPKSLEKAGELEKRSVDLALYYNRETKMVHFGSPLKVRSVMWHGQHEDYYGIHDYQAPCHTIVDNSPTNFTVADFDAINDAEDFNFDVTENLQPMKVKGEDLPKTITFLTGNGVKGALKITQIDTIGEKVVDFYGWIYTYPTNPKVHFEIKTPVSPRLLKIK